MAVYTSNRSPSPVSTRPNPNPNPNSINIPERENAIRKSFNGKPFPKPSVTPHSYGRSFNPTTPAYTSADHARRSSCGKGSIHSSWDYDHKENERDSKSRLVRAKSPSVSKGTKNFMSPTFSTTSKTNASPKKKVLSERNESVRTSASLLHGKFHFCTMNSLDAPEEIAVVVPPQNSPETSSIEAFPCLTATDFDKAGSKANKSPMTESKKDQESVSLDPASGVTNIERDDTVDLPFEALRLQGEPDLVVLSPEVALNCKFESSTLPDTPKFITDMVSPSILAPLNADQSVLPYDPETTYLSPRPQFLHYKPNPRIEVYLNKGKRLEDNFPFETSSEMRSTLEAQSEDSLQEYGDASSVEMLSKERNPESSEPHAITPHWLDETVEGKTVSKHYFSSKLKVIALFFVFLVTLLSTLAPHSPVIRNAVLQDQTIYKIFHDSHMVSDFAKENLNGLFQNARQLSAQFVNYLPWMTHGLREGNKVIPLQFSNSTALDDSGFHVVEHIELGQFCKGEPEVGLVKEIDRPVTWADSKVEQVPKLRSHVKLEELAPSAEGGEVIKVEDFRAEPLEENSGLFPDGYGQSEYDSEPMDESDIFVEESETHLALQTSMSVEGGEVIRVDDFREKNSGLFPNTYCQSEYNSESETQLAEQPALLELEHLEAVGNTQEENDIVSGKGDKLHNDIEAEDQLALPAREQEDECDLSYCDQFESGQTGGQLESLMHNASVGNYQFVKALGLGDTFLAPSSLGIYLLLVTLVAATVFTYVKRKKASLDNAASSVINEFTADKYVSKPLPLASTMEPAFPISPHSCSGPIEVDMIGESCPSEMSSFQKSSCYYSKKRLLGVDEAQSQERKPRRNYKRESLASSSEYTTASYGSFTTYSTIHTKDGDNEVVTPVRRSSRIRNKVISP